MNIDRFISGFELCYMILACKYRYWSKIFIYLAEIEKKKNVRIASGVSQIIKLHKWKKEEENLTAIENQSDHWVIDHEAA